MRSLNLIPLQHAAFCVNCEVISESLHGHCAACGSSALISLSRVLAGQELQTAHRRADDHPSGR
jgi:hypothetical protein